MSGTKQKLFIEASPIAEERFSGIGNTVINIIRELAADKDFCDKWEINLLIPFNKTKNLPRWNLTEQIKIKKVFAPGKLMNLFTRLGFMPYMDVFFGSGVYLFPNFKNWPLINSKSITYIHDIAFKRHPEYIHPKNLEMLENNLGKWLKRTDVVVCVSKYSKQELDTFYPEYKDKSKVVYNGVDVTEFYPRDKAEQTDIAKRFDLIPKQYFMFFSNLEPRKNVDGLLAAFRTFCDQNPDLKFPLLMVGGMGWKNEDILETIKNMNEKGQKVIIPDRFVTDEEVPALLSGAIAMVHVTHYEGFGLPQLQTLACGTPLISSKNTSLTEVLGDQAVYVNKEDPKEIASAMYKAYEVRDTVNSKSVEYAKAFTWHNSLGELKDIINSLG